MNRKAIFSWLIMFMLATGCDKEEEIPVSFPTTISEALKGNKWQLKNLIVYQPANTPILNLTTINFQPCELDNYFEFGEDNRFRESENILVCNPQGNSIFHKLDGGLWLVDESDSTLSIGAGFIFQEYKAAERNNNTMRWQQDVPDYLGGKQTYEYTLTSLK
jgi:hypothetical protein